MRRALLVFGNTRKAHLHHFGAVDDRGMRHENLIPAAAQQFEWTTPGLAMTDFQQSSNELATLLPASECNGTHIREIFPTSRMRHLTKLVQDMHSRGDHPGDK